ncbi:MAG: hypothetical protein JST89_24795 [Cyanobacteria bacterium SZAS-4]|nr:hypothetical protein [Cyanobacteria bacterium SZAS-4]
MNKRTIQQFSQGMLVVGFVTCGFNHSAYAHGHRTAIAGVTEETANYEETAPTAEQMRKWNAPIKGFHPIKRLLRPVWKLRRNAIEIEKKLEQIEVPVTKLQPSLISIDEKIGDVNGNMTEIQDKLSGLNGSIPVLNNNIAVFQGHVDELGRDVRSAASIKKELRDVVQMRQEMRQLDAQIAGLKKPLQQINKPVNEISAPLVSMNSELSGLNGNVATTSAQLNQVLSQVGAMRAEMKEMKLAMQELKQPVNSISSPVIAVHNDLKELSDVLMLALRTIMLTAIAAIAATLVLIIRFKESLVKLAARLSFSI